MRRARKAGALRRGAGWLAFMLAAAGCATVSPFSEAVLRDANRTLTPPRVLGESPQEEDRSTQGSAAAPAASQSPRDLATGPDREVLWGGRIAESRNLAGSTELSVIAYPLDRRGRPESDQDLLGRFIVVQKGYLETANFAPGREVTVHGRTAGSQEIALGEMRQLVPKVAPTQLYLWPEKPVRNWSPIYFGIGVSGGF